MGQYTQLKAENRALNEREIEAGALRLTSRPLRFWFDLYGECSLKCRHCGFQAHGRTSDQEVSEAVYQRVLRELMPTAYLCNLGGTNYGEMTISRNFHRFLRDCAEYDVKLNLTTNGTKISDDWLDLLLDRLSVIGFSMEGVGAIFERIRGFKWDKFRARVEKVAQGRERTGADFRIEWRYCAHADSIAQLPEMVRMAREIGVDRIQVMNLVPYVADQKFKGLAFHRTLANRCFAEAREEAARLGVEVNVPPDFDCGTWDLPGESCGDAPEGRGETRPVSLSIAGRAVDDADASASGEAAPADPVADLETLPNCYLPWQAVSINELGDVRPCCTYWRSVGSIAHGDFERVWNGRRYRALRSNINTKSNPICASCRQPRFDSESNMSSYQLAPSLKQLVKSQAERLLAPRRKRRYAGQLEPLFDPETYGARRTAATPDDRDKPDRGETPMRDAA